MFSRSLLRKKLIAAISLVYLLFVMLQPASFSQPGSTPRPITDVQIIQNLKSRLDRLVAQNRFSGTVLVAKNGKIFFEHAYGFADHAFNVPNKVDTKFNLGSMGKMFTAVSILQLVQEGKLSLSDTLIKTVPDYPNKKIASKVTIYQLLTHTSGLGDFFGKEFQDSSMAKYRTLESLLPLFVNKPLLFEPGTGWSYSNAGFIVLGLVIQHVSGQSYYSYVREHVFKPTGMLDTDNYNTDANVPNLALGYTTMGERPGSPRRSNIFSLQRGGSAGGGYSTVGDLFRFAEALEGHKLLNQKYTEMEMTGKVSTGEPGSSKYGFGMEEQFMNGVRIVGHGGGGPGINSNLDIYPSLDYVVAIMTNYGPGTVNLVNDRLRWELTGKELPSAIHLSHESLKGFAGKYAITPPPDAPQGMQFPPMEITAGQEGLSVGLGMGSKHDFRPLSSTEFFNDGVPDARLVFTKNDQGKVTGLTIRGTVVSPVPLKATKLP